MTKTETLNKLYQEYGLTNEDAFKSVQGWSIIARTGIDKIQAKSGILVDFEVIEYTPGKSAAIKATGTLGERRIETFGEAVKGKYPDGNTNTSYVLAMAEKRAMSRAVLKLAGFYQLGFYGEDEMDEQPIPEASEKKSIPTKAIDRGNSAILKGELTAEEVIEAAENRYVVGESVKYNWKRLKPQVA